MSMFKKVAPRPNQLGWVTSLSLSHNRDLIDVSSYGNPSDYIVGTQSVSFELRGMATNVSGLQAIFDKWLRGGIYEPTFQEEWRCLYCTSPNSISKTHCTQCGAPRSFILG